MDDFLDRRATTWNRAWMIIFGLWLLLLGRALAGIAGALTIAIALLTIGAAAGLVELAMAVWYRRLEPIVIGHRSGPDAPAPPVEPPVDPSVDDSSRASV